MENTLFDKSCCAALAFHKSLIGLSQLHALETLSSASKLTKCFEGRAIFTYYVVYHLFCACILLTPDKYLQEMKLDIKPPRDYKTWPREIINASAETPAQWELCKRAEQDWATNLTHTQIKKFCEAIRQRGTENFGEDALYLTPLFHHFIDTTDSETNCIPALYEKLCYVRDRVLYRPSHVISKEGDILQTSAQLHNELTSLPSAQALFTAIMEVYKGILTSSQAAKKPSDTWQTLHLFFYLLWEDQVLDDINDLCKLGHSRRRLLLLGERVTKNKYAFPTYICHLLELENIDFIRKYKKQYWLPLEQMYHSLEETVCV